MGFKHMRIIMRNVNFFFLHACCPVLNVFEKLLIYNFALNDYNILNFRVLYSMFLQLYIINIIKLQIFFQQV